jgi:hypothetical protein
MHRRHGMFVESQSAYWSKVVKDSQIKMMHQ